MSPKGCVMGALVEALAQSSDCLEGVQRRRRIMERERRVGEGAQKERTRPESGGVDLRQVGKRQVVG